MDENWKNILIGLGLIAGITIFLMAVLGVFEVCHNAKGLFGWFCEIAIIVTYIGCSK